MKRLATLFLTVQGAGVLAWWVVMLLYPSARVPFMAPGAPDATLLSFLLPDLALYAAGSLVAAYGLTLNRGWAWPALCIHTGAAAYAALSGLMLPALSGGGWGGLFMLPSLVVLPFFVWRLRPTWHQ